MDGHHQGNQPARKRRRVVPTLQLPSHDSVQMNAQQRPGPEFGGRIEGTWRGQPRSPTAQGSVEEGTRLVSRVACKRGTRLNIEIHPKISGEDRRLRKDALATSIGDSGTSAGRSSQQCVGAPAQQSRSAGTDGRRGPRGGDPEIESPGRGVAARASGGARNGGESCQEGSDSIHTNVGFGPIAFWSSRIRITQRVQFDVEQHQCRRFHVERSPRCLISRRARAGTD